MAAEVAASNTITLEDHTSDSGDPWSHGSTEEAQSPMDSDSGSDYSNTRSSRASLRASQDLQSSIGTGDVPSQLGSADLYTALAPAFPGRSSGGSWEAGGEAKATEEHDTTESSKDENSEAPKQEPLNVDTGSSGAQSASHSRTSSQATEIAAIPNSPQVQSPGSNYSDPASPPQTPTKDLSPATPVGTRSSNGSYASIALSENSMDYDHLAAKRVDDVLSTPRVSSMAHHRAHSRKLSALSILQPPWGPTRQDTLFDMSKEEATPSPFDEDGKRLSSHASTPSVNISEMDDAASAWTEDHGSDNELPTPRRSSSGSEGIEVDWLALDKTEEQEKEDKDLPEGMEDESTKFLLARLEQENAKFDSHPKAAAATAAAKPPISRSRSNTRPPSMAHLRKLVSDRDTPTIRYSLAPTMSLPEEPPPMTELEFWAALVQDYPSTAARLPTLTTTKIRAGIPPPLRGVVWASMSGARDKTLEDSFETLQHEKSPYEGIINKDVGRSFPGVELFRDADGEGQRMLGRVLKCFSLHDQDIGYCQGLGFLVGPLLMNLGEREAFCVLVRLMDHYALRPSFLPSLSGLHMRIFQFSTLLKQHHPALFAHLSELGVEPAYLSQWFLSCFAVTCPLSMLFRIYDVIFAEGANETVMRVALALFRRNEKKIMESVEFEEVMQLLLGRSLWDCYGFSADELVDDFTSLGNIITHERLAELEFQFENQSKEVVSQSAGFLPDVQAAASKFLGRLWTPTHLHTPSKGSTSLSPQSAEKEASASTPAAFLKGGFLRRSPSKQSLGNFNEHVSEDSTSSGSTSLASTAPTDGDVHFAARESQADTASLKSKTTSVSVNQYGVSREQYDLHSQIEDLLMALSEAQREHAQLASMLQKEREERNDDHRVVRLLVNKLHKGGKDTKQNNRKSMPPPSRPKSDEFETPPTSAAEKRKTMPPRTPPKPKKAPVVAKLEKIVDEDDIPDLVEQVEARLASNARFSITFETKAHLRSTLTRTREQLATAEQNLKELTDRAEYAEASLVTFQDEGDSLRAEVEELRSRVNEEFRTRQKLELQVQNMEIQIKMEARSLSRRERLERAESSGEMTTLSKIDTSAGSSRARQNSMSSASAQQGGLRELKLGRRDSAGSVASIRSMKSQRRTSTSPAIGVTPSPPNGLVIEPTPQPQAEVSKIESEPATIQASEPLVAPAGVSVQAPSPPPPPQTFEPQAPATAPAAPAATTTTALPDAATAAPAGAAAAASSSSLSVPFQRTGFARRTTSLAAKEIPVTAAHEPVAEDALLVELVNAKTSEAQARQELDEMRRAMNQQKRKAEETLAQIKAEADAVREVARKAREDAIKAREEAEKGRAEVFDAEALSTPALSWPATPALDSTASPVNMTPVDEGNGAIGGAALKKSETPPSTGANAAAAAAASSAASAASAVGGWFWGRRTASTTKAVVDGGSSS